ncbi:MAG: aldolase catalytic domain-containing protein [Clostridium sp.]
MKELKLLDCTLRDGGFVNDWDFGHDNIVNIFERMISSGTDVLEIGFLDERRPFDKDRTMMPDTQSADRIFQKLDKKQAMIVAMIDYGTCSIDRLAPCSETFIDGIRVIFKKHVMKEALAYCAQIKALGYQVFVQAVSITSYSDRELLDLIDMVNAMDPYALSIVDTYGLMHQENLMHYFELLNHNLHLEIAIGYHSHNNFQLAYSNSIEMMKKPTERTIMIDASLYGMGKSAGNLPIELIAMYMNTNYGKHYDLSQMLEAIDINIMPFYAKTPWGYNLFFYIAASNNCHPSYVRFLMDKQTLSLKSINTILERIEPEKKLLYDKDYIEQLYVDYQNMECNDQADIAALKEQLSGKSLLLLGPGKNMELQKKKILRYIKAESPIILSVNYIPEDIDIDYAFLSNSRRYVQLNTRLLELTEESAGRVKVIATSNVTNVNDHFDYTLNYNSLIDRSAEIIDNSFVMLLNALVNIGVTHAACAGFDGYKSRGDNYFNEAMDYRIGAEKSMGVNKHVIRTLERLKDVLSIEFVTDSYYKTEE